MSISDSVIPSFCYICEARTMRPYGKYELDCITEYFCSKTCMRRAIDAFASRYFKVIKENQLKRSTAMEDLRLSSYEEIETNTGVRMFSMKRFTPTRICDYHKEYDATIPNPPCLEEGNVKDSQSGHPDQ